MKIAESELIINGDGSVFHLHIKPEQLAGSIILVGDPGRVPTLKKQADSIRCEGASREFVWFTGEYKGREFTCLSTGIGTDNIDIVMTELDALANVDFRTRETKEEHRALNILRIGPTGAIQSDIPLGSFIMSHISIGFDGLLNWYAGRESISLPDFEEAFSKQVRWDRHLPSPYFVKSSEKICSMFEGCSVKGMTVSAPGFYGPQGRIVRQELALPHLIDDLRAFEYEGFRITNFEMESSAIAGFAAKLGHNAATVCCAIANRYAQNANTNYANGIEDLIALSLEKFLP